MSQEKLHTIIMQFWGEGGGVGGGGGEVGGGKRCIMGHVQEENSIRVILS